MASSIASVQSDDRNQNQSQSNILSQLNYLLKNNPLLSGNLLSDSIVISGATKHTQGITLAMGDNTINHGLGRPLVGWFVTRNSASATFYDKQATNSVNGVSQTNLTLILNASAATTVNIFVF